MFTQVGSCYVYDSVFFFHVTLYFPLLILDLMHLLNMCITVQLCMLFCILLLLSKNINLKPFYM